MASSNYSNRNEDYEDLVSDESSETLGVEDELPGTEAMPLEISTDDEEDEIENEDEIEDEVEIDDAVDLGNEMEVSSDTGDIYERYDHAEEAAVEEDDPEDTFDELDPEALRPLVQAVTRHDEIHQAIFDQSTNPQLAWSERRTFAPHFAAMAERGFRLPDAHQILEIAYEIEGVGEAGHAAWFEWLITRSDAALRKRFDKVADTLLGDCTPAIRAEGRRLYRIRGFPTWYIETYVEALRDQELDEADILVHLRDVLGAINTEEWYRENLPGWDHLFPLPGESVEEYSEDGDETVEGIDTTMEETEQDILEDEPIDEEEEFGYDYEAGAEEYNDELNGEEEVFEEEEEFTSSPKKATPSPTGASNDSFNATRRGLDLSPEEFDSLLAQNLPPAPGRRSPSTSKTPPQKSPRPSTTSSTDPLRQKLDEMLDQGALPEWYPPFSPSQHTSTRSPSRSRASTPGASPGRRQPDDNELEDLFGDDYMPIRSPHRQLPNGLEDLFPTSTSPKRTKLVPKRYRPTPTWINTGTPSNPRWQRSSPSLSSKSSPASYRTSSYRPSVSNTLSSASPRTPAAFDAYMSANRPSTNKKTLSSGRRPFQEWKIEKTDPLRYKNKLVGPRRLPNTPTKSHLPPSPRRKGPKSCPTCGRAFRVTKRTKAKKKPIAAAAEEIGLATPDATSPAAASPEKSTPRRSGRARKAPGKYA